MTKQKPKAPVTLEATGAALWDEVLSVYELRADELLTLEDLCGASDSLARLMKRHAELGFPDMSTGSMGQEVEHPLIGSIDKQRKTRNTLRAALKLPDVEAGEGIQPNQHRAAAQSKWTAEHGKGA